MQKPRKRLPGFQDFLNRTQGAPVSTNMNVRKAILADTRSALTAKEERGAWQKHAKNYLKIERDMKVRLYSEQVLAEELGYLAMKPADRVTSIGSGGAPLELYMAKNIVPNGFVTAVDFAHEMNVHAVAAIGKAEVKNMKVIEGDARHIPIKSNSQDKVFLDTGVLFVGGFGAKFGMILKEARGIIRNSPDSRLTFNCSPKEFGEKQRKALAESSFRLTATKLMEFPPLKKGKPNIRVLIVVARPV